MTWGERNGVAVIAQESGDPAAVVFDAISAARVIHLKNGQLVAIDKATQAPVFAAPDPDFSPAPTPGQDDAEGERA